MKQYMKQYFAQYLTWSFLIKLIIAMALMGIYEAIFGNVNWAVKLMVYVFYWAVIDWLFPHKASS